MQLHYGLSTPISELKAKGVMWFEDLEELTDEALRDAVKAARKACKFCPTSADVLAAHRDAAQRPQHSLPSAQDARALPAGTGQPLVMSEAQAARNIAHARELLARLQRNMTA